MKNSMAKRKTLARFIYGEPQPSLGTLEILREAFKATIRNGRIALFITFIMFSFHSLMELADQIVLAPVLTELGAKSKIAPTDVNIKKADPALYKAISTGVRYFLSYELVHLSYSCLLLMFSLAASVYSTYEAYTGKALSLKDMLVGSIGRLKRPLITLFWTIIISLASAIIFLAIIGVVKVMFEEGSVLTILDFTMLILGLCYYFYICALWMLSHVVSVMEEKQSGLKAIDRARELMKGRRLQGSLLMVILMLPSVVTHKAFFLFAANKARFLAFIITISGVWWFCLIKLSVFAVFTIFYLECRKLHAVEKSPNASYAPASSVSVEF